MNRYDDAPNGERDEELGALLRTLDVPEHAPGFLDRVGALLADEEAVATAAAAPPGAAGRDGVVTTFREPRRRWRRQALRVAVVAAAAGVIGVAAGVNLDTPSTTSRPDRPRVTALPTAVEVARRMHAALGSVSTLRGEIVFRDDQGEVRAAFVVTEEGDFRQRGITRREEFAYDARTGVERGYFVDPEGPDFGGERTGLAPGAPDGGPTNWILRRELGSTVRALLAEDSQLTVQETTYDGREAWLLETDVEPNKIGGGGDHLSVTVDRESGYPVRIVETARGALFREVRLEKLVTDGPVDRSEFSLEFPPGVEVSRFDEGWRRLDTLAQVQAEVGYAPLVPGAGALPEGFELGQISVADRTPQGTGVEAMNPPTREAVSMVFHRGLDRILVTTRLRGDVIEGREPGDAPGQCVECLGDSSWSDPLASGEGFTDNPEELVVSAGALAGSPGQLLIGPHTVPHVWALSDELVVTVSGDATRAELVAILESLEPHEG